MKKIYFIILSLFFGSLLLLPSCAKRGFITGGAKDTIPPKIVSSSPENYNTNFSGKEIKIVFDELIKVKDINKQLIISPPMNKRPIIVPQGSASRFISIKIQDTLQPNTTYSFNFGQSITDNNEGNPYSQYRYVFSTGSYIDSLQLGGKIKDALEQKTDNFVSIQLYDAATFTDSTIYKEPPLYIANTLDSSKVFKLENLKAGSYYMIALKDQNNNYKFDPRFDKIGFLKDKITLPNDTIFELELFKEKATLKVDKPTQESSNKFFLAFEGEIKKSKISATNGKENIPVRMMNFPVSGKDSVQLFVPNMEKDSLIFTVEADNYKKSFTSKIKKIQETDSLSIDAKQKGTLAFRDQFTLKTNTPIDQFNNEKITLLNKDSEKVAFTTKYNEFEREIVFDFKKEENEKYKMTALPGAFVDFYNTPNDTLKFNFTTKQYSDYGNLRVNLKSINRFPIILQVLNAKGDVIAEDYSEGETTLNFELLEPNLFTLRIIYDDNKNRIWDTGNFLEKRQAEEIIYFPKAIDVRANWDVEQDF